MRLIKLLYGVIGTLMLPVILIKLLWRSRHIPAYRHRLSERFGFFKLPLGLKNSIWIHGVSVGETLVAIRLLKEMKEKYPHHQFLLTTMTPTASQRARELLPEDVVHVYIPYDFPWAVKRFLKAVRPALVVMIEGEIWPYLYWSLQASKTPLLIANARMSQRSYRSYSKFNWFFKDVFSAVSMVASQSRADAARFVRLGVAKSHVKVLGNLKFDVDLPDNTVELGRQFRQQYGQTKRPIVVAASTHPGEDELVLSAFSQLVVKFPNALLCLVPRHIERSDDIRRLAEGIAMQVTLRGDGIGPPAIGHGVYIVNTLGELGIFYAAADVAFIGGSLVPIGGHNPVEAILMGCPVVVGPYLFNFTDVFRQIRHADGCLVVRDAKSLYQAWSVCLKSDKAAEMAARSAEVVNASRGVLQAYMKYFEQWFEVSVS